MRIGIDMLGVQSPHHGHRGIGRYGLHLVSGLLGLGDGHEYVLYAHGGLATDRVPESPRAGVRRLGPGAGEPGDGLTVSQRLERLARRNPDGLDALLLLSPFEYWSDYHPPGRSPGGPRLVTVVHDMIPFLFPRDEAPDATLMRHYRVLEDLKRYDALLANSEATRRDTLRLLGLPGERVATIGGASDGTYFTPDPLGGPDASSRAVLEGLGIAGRYVLNVGGFDVRKNLWRLIDAFALLPEPLRRGTQLVLTFTVLPTDRQHLLDYARAAGLDEGSLIVTGEVSDEALRVLYRRCEAFAFPSLYEGFGLPLLEAMHCGAAVVAGNNSSQVEVVGQAGLLANAGDAGDIAAQLARVLGDAALRRELRSRAAEQAGRFSWERTARAASAALEALPSRRGAGSTPRRRPGRPRIAFFSPFPPRKSGISDYSAALLGELKSSYAIDLYHAPGYVPEPALADAALGCCDARLFPRRASARDYHAAVYQMGNSRHHRFLYATMLRHPGVVTLHDYCLSGFHLDHGERLGRGEAYLREELLRWHPEESEAIGWVLGRHRGDWDAIGRECAARGWALNRGVVRASGRLVVHSPWCLERLRRECPEDAGRVEVIPLGARPRREATASRRASIRGRFGLPGGALVVASLGFVNGDKLGPEALEAFGAVAESDASALFVFAGEEADGGEARRRARSLGLSGRVRFLGRQTSSDYAALVEAVDVGVNLRRPPTNGETSAALLDLLSAGVPTVVTDTGTFGDYPDTVVRKVRWDGDGPSALRRALVGLASDRVGREALGRSARQYVARRHAWPVVAGLYVEAIERCHAELSRGAASAGRRRSG